jgi:hypothetical protein
MSAQDIHEHLIVDTSRTITGTLRAGATIRSRSQLTVLGLVTGAVHVEEDSILMVQGSFDGSIVNNEGTIILYGQATLDLDSIAGKVAVGIDSLLITPQGDFRLLHDGALEELTESRYPAGSFNVHTNQLCYFDTKLNRFQALGDLT